MSDRKCCVAIYCRVAQADNYGLWAQQKTMRAFAASLGFRDCAEYADNGYSGRTLDRPAFNKMMEDVNAGIINTILVRDISRISRDYALFVNWLKQIQAQNIDIVSLQEKDFQLNILKKWNISQTKVCDFLQ